MNISKMSKSEIEPLHSELMICVEWKCQPSNEIWNPGLCMQYLGTGVENDIEKKSLDIPFPSFFKQ